jgi:hypothetical protein
MINDNSYLTKLLSNVFVIKSNTKVAQLKGPVNSQ